MFLHKLGIRVLCMLRCSVCACCTRNNRNNAPATPGAMTEDKKQQTGTLLKRPSDYVGCARPKCCCTKCCCSECCFTGKPETGKPENRKSAAAGFRAGFRAVSVLVSVLFLCMVSSFVRIRECPWYLKPDTEESRVTLWPTKGLSYVYNENNTMFITTRHG